MAKPKDSGEMHWWRRRSKHWYKVNDGDGATTHFWVLECGLFDVYVRRTGRVQYTLTVIALCGSIDRCQKENFFGSLPAAKSHARFLAMETLSETLHSVSKMTTEELRTLR